MLRIKSSLVFRVPVMLPLFCFYSFDSSIHLLFYSLSSICPPFCPTSPHFHWLFLFLIEAASRRRTVYEESSKSSRSSGNYDASTIPARSTGQTWPSREHEIYRSTTCSYRVRLISEPNAVSLESTAPLTFPRALYERQTDDASHVWSTFARSMRLLWIISSNGRMRTRFNAFSLYLDVFCYSLRFTARTPDISRSYSIYALIGVRRSFGKAATVVHADRASFCSFNNAKCFGEMFLV